MTLRALFYIEQNYAFAILRPLQHELLLAGFEVRWFIASDHITTSYFELDEYRLSSVDEVRRWQPGVVFVPGNVVPNFISGLKVAVFHGFNAGKINRRGREDHFEIRNCFDLYCTQGPSTTKPFLALKEKHRFFDVVETGWPMVDPLFRPKKNNSFIDCEDNRPTVLFCSTFSRKYSCAEIMYEEIKRLKLLGHYRWLVQFHPKMPIDTVEKYKALQDNNMQFIETDDVISLLQAADIMLCDTSSVSLMFLLLNKPVVTFRNQSPGDHLLDVEAVSEVGQALAIAVTRPIDLIRKMGAYCQEMHPYQDGQSSRRVVDAVLNALAAGLDVRKRRPFNLIRELKMRKQLNYWRL